MSEFNCSDKDNCNRSPNQVLATNGSLIDKMSNIQVVLLVFCSAAVAVFGAREYKVQLFSSLLLLLL